MFYLPPFPQSAPPSPHVLQVLQLIEHELDAKLLLDGDYVNEKVKTDPQKCVATITLTFVFSRPRNIHHSLQEDAPFHAILKRAKSIIRLKSTLNRLPDFNDRSVHKAAAGQTHPWPLCNTDYTSHPNALSFPTSRTSSICTKPENTKIDFSFRTLKRNWYSL